MYDVNERALLWLNMDATLSPEKKNRLYEGYSSAEEMYENFQEDTEFAREIIGDKHYETLLSFHDRAIIDKHISEMETKDIVAVTMLSDNYPVSLANIDYPPVVIYCKGNIDLLSGNLMIAVVGTRKVTRYGKDVTNKLGRELAYNNFTIVSGLARGVDTLAHKAALENGGKTIAVLGNGLDVVYPSENRDLAIEIAEKGLLITEFPLGTLPKAYNFPQRNRIISGLASSVLITEAGERSGTMITASEAVEQGKDIFCVPGSIFSEQSAGTNRMLKEGRAYYITSVNDIYEKYGVKNKYVNASEIQLSFIEQSIIDELKDGEAHFEELLSKSNLEVSALMSILTNLELCGLVRKLPGNYYCKIEI